MTRRTGTSTLASGPGRAARARFRGRPPCGARQSEGAIALARPRQDGHTDSSASPPPGTGKSGPGQPPALVEGPAAFGAPGAPPTWAHGSKQAVGTCLTRESPVWFTVAEGVLTECYYPRVDLANTRDLQFILAGDGADAFFEERRDTLAKVEVADPHALLWDVTTTERQGRFEITKRILTDAARPAVVMRCRIRGPRGGALRDLRPYVLLAPHVADRGGGNSARLMAVGERTVLVAHRHDSFVALACSLPLPEASAGYVGVSDGWTDLSRNRRLTWHAAAAQDGNVALVAALGGDPGKPFSVALGFGRNASAAVDAACAAADADFAALEAQYVASWHQYCDGLLDLSRVSGDAGRLYWLSAMVVRAHEDRENPGAHIASLAVPWGDAQGDDNRAGYHLVWPRDLYHAATARLAAGDGPGALRTLHYLGRTQRADGSWPQNFWVFGEPYWHGLQLDEIAFPILLAWQLRRADALDWNPYPSLVAPAAYRIAKVGPVTQQERWEENSGYSPSTLAAAIAGLVCASEFAHGDRDPEAARYFLEVADYWARHLEDWTFTTSGDAGGHHEYYERIASVLPDVPAHLGRAVLKLANRTSGEQNLTESAVIDGGFLELVRYGCRRPDDRHITESLRAYDAVARVETPRGPCWHRYTFDGYGEKADGTPYDGTGVGRAWPLLTGERAHYALAAKEDPTALRSALEAFVTAGGMIPEQVWDRPDIPERGLFFGRPSGSAAPLVWAHAEYIKLLRSIADASVFDCPEPVRRRYTNARSRLSSTVIWKHNHKIREVGPKDVLRIEVYAPASLHWSDDGWQTVHHDPMEPRGRGVWTYDFAKGSVGAGGLDFTFWWNDREVWEGSNYRVEGGQPG